MSANYICPQNCNNFQHCCRISTKHIDAANSVNDDNDIQYKFCQHISIVNVSNILGAIVKNYVYPETNICLYLGENTTTTNNNTIKKYHYLHDQFIYIYHNRKYEILVKSIQVKLSIHPSIQPIQGSGLNSYKDYCILPETTETIGKLKQQLATKYGLQLTNLIMFLSDLTNNNFKRQLTDDMPIVFAWLYPNITDSCINILPQRYSSCTDCYDSCHQYYCRIDIKQIDPNNNNSSGGDEDIKYLFCRHTVRVAVEDIFKASVDGYSDTDISLEILSINNNTDNTIDDDNDNNDTNWWLTKDKSIDFTDYTVEQKQSGSIGFAVRAVRVRINVSLAALKQQSQGSTANQTYDILPIQTPTIGQLKHKLALKYMFATETHTLYLTDLSDTNAPQEGRQLNDDQSIANAWLYGTYSRSVITVIPNKGVKQLTDVINRSNDLILEKITTLLTANSGQSFRNQTTDDITDAVINANNNILTENNKQLLQTISQSLITVNNNNNDLLTAKLTELSTNLSDTMRDCFTNQTISITDTVITNNNNNNDLLIEKLTELSTNLSETMSTMNTCLTETINKCFANQSKAITDAIITSNTNKDNNDVITTGKLMSCLANQTKHLMNVLTVRDKYLSDILVDKSDTDSQWTSSQSIVRLVDESIDDDNQSDDNNNKTIGSQSVTESLDNNHNNTNPNDININNTDNYNQLNCEFNGNVVDYHQIDVKHRDSDEIQELKDMIKQMQIRISELEKK